MSFFHLADFTVPRFQRLYCRYLSLKTKMVKGHFPLERVRGKRRGDGLISGSCGAEWSMTPWFANYWAQ